jgi:hypothetical protein
MESETIFDKLKESGLPSNIKERIQKGLIDEEEEMAEKNFSWKIVNSGEYQDLIAPFDNTEDYSTASNMKNKGPNITLEKLAVLSVEEMVQEIIRKAGIIDYERLVRLLHSAC